MIKKIEKLILSKVKTAQKTPQDISTYSLVRPSNGLFYLKIYWKGKAKKGGKTAIMIDLSFKASDAKDGIDAIEMVLKNAKEIEIDFDQQIQHTDAKEGW